MRLTILVLAACLAPVAACSDAADASGQENAGARDRPPAAATDEAAIFRAAGFTRKADQWHGCGDETGSPAYEPGTIAETRDLDGDGRPEAVVTEGSSFCFGMTGMGYSLVSQQTDGSWKLIDQRPGIPRFLASKGIGGWPDIEVGGPGFCFPVLRWNGSAYAVHRSEYEGKACRPE